MLSLLFTQCHEPTLNQKIKVSGFSSDLCFIPLSTCQTMLLEIQIRSEIVYFTSVVINLELKTNMWQNWLYCDRQRNQDFIALQWKAVEQTAFFSFVFLVKTCIRHCIWNSCKILTDIALSWHDIGDLTSPSPASDYPLKAYPREFFQILKFFFHWFIILYKILILQIYFNIIFLAYGENHPHSPYAKRVYWSKVMKLSVVRYPIIWSHDDIKLSCTDRTSNIWYCPLHVYVY